jgi:hypothetical protein
MDHGYLEIKFTKESSQKDGEDLLGPVLNTLILIFSTRTPIAHILD